MNARRARSELLPGTLEMLVLKTLSLQPMHGYGIAQHIQKVSVAGRRQLGAEEASFSEVFAAIQRILKASG